MSFNRYESRPITRLAHCINAASSLEQCEEPNTWAVLVDGHRITFKAYEAPLVGDYVVYLNDEDVYHCTQEVFVARNIVPEAEEPALD
jgi:hypothetical protein